MLAVELLEDTPVKVVRDSSPTVQWSVQERPTKTPYVIPVGAVVELRRWDDRQDDEPAVPTKTSADGSLQVTSRPGGVVQCTFALSETTETGTTFYRIDVVEGTSRNPVAKGPFIVGL